MMSRRIESAIRSNQGRPIFAKLTWLPILERSLKQRTVEYLDQPEANLKHIGVRPHYKAVT